MKMVQYLVNVSIEANSVGQDQTGTVWSAGIYTVEKALNVFQQTIRQTPLVVSSALRVKTVINVY